MVLTSLGNIGLLHWASPPCPYPTNTIPWQLQTCGASSASSSDQSSILGPRPAQNFYMGHTTLTPSHCYVLIDVDQAMHTLSMYSPDSQYYMDTSATSHMTNSQGEHTKKIKIYYFIHSITND